MWALFVLGNIVLQRMNIQRFWPYLITLYVEYNDGNGLLSGICYSVHGFDMLDSGIKLPPSESVGSNFRFISYLAL